MDKKEFMKILDEHVKKTGIHYNPDSKVFNDLIKVLLERDIKFGAPYCPCRIISKNKEKDKEIVCPCVFHRGEIELQGHCLCGLFVK